MPCPGVAPDCSGLGPGFNPRCHGDNWLCERLGGAPETQPGTGTQPQCPTGQVWNRDSFQCVFPPETCPPDPPCASGYRKQTVGGITQCVPCGTPDPPPDNGGCPPGQHRGGGHPGNPCRPDQPGTPASGGGGGPTSSQVPRFFTDDWMDYLYSGQLDTGVPQPTGSLLEFLQGALFQQVAGQFGIAEQQRYQQARQTRMQGRGDSRLPTPGVRAGNDRVGPAPGERDISVLGLNNGAAAIGYIDPSWRYDTRTTGGGGGGGGQPAPAPPPPGGGGGGSVPPSEDGSCPPGYHRGGGHPGNPCRPDSETAPPGGQPPANQPPGSPPASGGNPCGGTQGCPPGQHRGGCHPGNPCRPDNAPMNGLTGGVLTPMTGLLSAFSNKPQTGLPMMGLF